MTHRFSIKEIARQAALGTATVDRVLNNRAHVSAQTHRRVAAAIAELEMQENQLSARGRRLFIDIVVEAPRRFSDQIRKATNAALPQVSDAIYRPRFTFQEVMTDRDMTAILTRIKKRGSHGVCLKARDLPSVSHMVNELQAAHIPVVTLVTDLPNTKRVAYVGLDNARAGSVAAYLLSQSLHQDDPLILCSRSQESFFGETERFHHFTQSLARYFKAPTIVELNRSAGVEYHIKQAFASLNPSLQHLDAVYSMGGGNRVINDFLTNQRLYPRCFIAHDLDQENLTLLQNQHLTYVLNHNLKKDMKNAFHAFSCYHKLTTSPVQIKPSDIEIITPMNIPVLPKL